jgi:hypothetical protein
MRIIQALHWLRDIVRNSKSERQLIGDKLILFIKHSNQQAILLRDIREGLSTMPGWAQTFLNDILESMDKENNENK